MTRIVGSLADSLSNLHGAFMLALVDPHEERLWGRDWPIASRGVAVAIDRLGSPVWFQARDAYSPEDDRPFVVVSIDPATRLVRFDVASSEETAEALDANLYQWDGRLIGD